MMQIRPGFSLLQAIAKASEPKPVPFAQRLADLGASGPATAATPVRASPDHDIRDPAAAAQTQRDARTSAAVKPRGSVLNVVV